MKDTRKLLLAIPAAALVLCLAASYATRGAMQHLSFLNRNGNPRNGDLVDQSPWLMAQALTPLAVSAEEKSFARDAERLADHEVDQAFAMALRQASDQPRTLTGKALALQQRITQIQQTVKDDQARVDALTARSGKTPAGTPAAGSDLAVAKAQLGLDSDILGDAVVDLARESGDQRTKIQQELASREAAMKKYDSQSGDEGELAVLVERQHSTLYGRLAAWFSQRSRVALIEQARQQALQAAARLTAQHDALEEVAVADETKGPGQSLTGEARVEALQTMASRRRVLSILDDQIETEQQLSVVYGRWISQVWLQHKIVMHMIFQSFAWIALIVFSTTLFTWIFTMILDRLSQNRRQKRTLRAILDVGVQLVGLLLILLVIFGMPRQMPTILGLLTAGLTLVFQDFILAFFGWFVLIGKHGIRIGDWVEINGVGGEVMEIGLFRTALLETGNWTANGHPTGRRTTFINSFAIRGQYFNFTTAGQWMWDEIRVTIPAGEQTYSLIEKIHSAVTKATEPDMAAAEEEWQRLAQRNGMLHFSAAPSVDVRPSPAGVDIVVGYVTRAGERLEMRNRLYQEAVDLLHESSAAPLAGAAAVPQS